MTLREGILESLGSLGLLLRFQLRILRMTLANRINTLWELTCLRVGLLFELVLATGLMLASVRTELSLSSLSELELLGAPFAYWRASSSEAAVISSSSPLESLGSEASLACVRLG